MLASAFLSGWMVTACTGACFASVLLVLELLLDARPKKGELAVERRLSLGRGDHLQVLERGHEPA